MIQPLHQPKPANHLRLLNRFLLRHRLLLFLISLLSLMVIFPVIQSEYTQYLPLLEFLFGLILIAGIYAVSPNRQLLMIVILLASLIFIVFGFNLLLKSRGLLFFGIFLAILFFIITTATIIGYVLVYRRVTADKIYGAICGYLLIGIVWALIYTLIENFIPGSFHFTHPINARFTSPFAHPFYFPELMYYSFITLTTTGFGDVTPITSFSRAISSLEAISGELYIAVLIARLVGLQITHSILYKR